MEKNRSIPYGVSDYAQMRKQNAWFVDRTAKIKAEAMRHLDQYSKGHDLTVEWHSVMLHRLVLVFHGGAAVLVEEG